MDEKNCLLCKRTFSNETGLQRHISLLHSQKEKKAFQCSYCNATFSSSKYLSAHIACVHSAPYNCKICAKTYKTANNLTNHTKLSHKKKKKTAKEVDFINAEMSQYNWKKKLIHKHELEKFGMFITRTHVL